MDITPQIISKLSQANHVLIVTVGASGDSLAAGLALQHFLRKLEKEADVLAVGAKPAQFNFLPGFGDVAAGLDVAKNFVIDVSTKQTQIEELSYKKDDQRLSIFIKPKTGEFRPA